MQLSAFAAARAKRKLAEVEAEDNGRVSLRIESQEVTTSKKRIEERTFDQDAPGILPSSTAIDVRAHRLDPSEISDTPEHLEQFDPVANSNILSTWIPKSTNYKQLNHDTFHIRLEANDTLCFIGECCVQVLAGSLAFYGAILEASSEMYTVFAPSTHDLPLFECKSEYATALFKFRDTGLRVLGRLSPLFGKIWNAKANDVGLAGSLNCSSFTYLQKASDDSLKRIIRPMHLPESWESALQVRVSPDVFGYRPISLVCGAKGSEKATFARCLLNRLYSQISRVDARQNAEDDANGIIWLDLDPSQPEFTPPGQISLIHVRAAVFGPSYTHTTDHLHNNDICRIDQAYAFGTSNYVEDGDRYLRCVKQMLEDFTLGYPVQPVVITLPTWAGFSGLHLLIDTVEQIQKNVQELSHVFYVGEFCPAQLHELFTERLHHLLVPETGSFSRRSAAELRAMQTMSYFHSQSDANGSNGNSSLKWKCIPLTGIRPWVVSYSKKGASLGIQAILQMTETHPSEMLSIVLNGRVLSVAYLPTVFNNPLDSNGTADVDMEDIDKNNTNTFPTPVILRTSSENIPYVNPDRTATLIEKHGMPHTLGHALIRAIDTQNQNFHLLTPIPAHAIRQALLDISSTSSRRGHSGTEDNQVNDDENISSGLILILGTLDTPDWAYLENGYLADHIGRNEDVRRKGEEADGKDDSSDDEDEGEEEEDEEVSLQMKYQKNPAVDNDILRNETGLDHHNNHVDNATYMSKRKFAHVPWVKEVDRTGTSGASNGISGLGSLKRRVRRI